MELWIGSIPKYPIISKTSELVLLELLSTTIAEATKTRSELCKAYFTIISKLSFLEVPEDHEQALFLAIVEANKNSDRILERTEESKSKSDLWK